MLSITIISTNFKSYSAVIPNCFFIEWAPGIRKRLYLILNICTLGPILSRFPDWCQFIYTFSIAISYLFAFLYLQMYPFFHSYANCIFSILSFYLILQEISFSFKTILSSSFPILYEMIIPFSLSVLAIPIYMYLFHKRNQKIVSFLNGSQLNDYEKLSLFDTKIFQNIYQVLPYLQIGVENNLYYIIDFSFLHYLAARMRNKLILLSVARVVVFFPTETNFLNLILEAIEKFDDINLSQRFFLFHVKKIIAMRQTHNIDEINIHLYNLRKSSKDMIESIRGLWLEIIHSSGPISYTTFRYIHDTSHKMKNQFLDTISKCSDSYEAIDEYAYFLIEGLSDFSGSVEWEMKKRMIEKGIKMGIDFSFISFVNVFPHYLTKDIMDRRGNFIYNDYIKQNLVLLTSAPSLITMDNLEYIEKSSSLIDDTISQGLLRVSIQNALKPATYKTLKSYECLNIVQFISIIVLFIFFATFLQFENDDSFKILNSLDMISCTSIDLLLNAYYQSVQVAFDDDQIWTEWDNESLPMSNDDFAKIQSMNNNTNAILSIVDSTLEHCILFFDTFQQNPEVFDFCQFLFEPTFELNIFQFYVIDKVIENLTFPQMIQYVSSLSQRTASQSSNPSFVSNQIDNRLTVAYNCINLGRVIENLREDLIGRFNEIDVTEKTTNLTFGILLCTAFCVIFLPLQIVFIYNLYSSVSETLKTLQKVNEEMVDKSLFPIQLHQMPQTLSKGSYLLIFQGGIAFVVLPILGVLSVLFPAAILFLIPYENFQMVKKRIDCLVWHHLSGSRLSSAALGVSVAFINLVINYDYNYLLINVFNTTIQRLMIAQSLLLMGNEKYHTIIGADKQLNEFLFLDTCEETSANNSAFVDYMKCISVDRAVNYLQYLFIKIIYKFSEKIQNTFSDFLYDDYIDNLLLMDFRLISSIKEYQILILQFVNDSFAENDKKMIIILFVSICISALIFISIILGPLYTLRLSFEGIKQMVRFLPPADIINSQQLLSSVLTTNEKSFVLNDGVAQSQARAILTAARDGIISINSSGIIEMINQSFMNMSGYDQDQLIGQHFLSLFTSLPDADVAVDHNKDIQKLTNAMDLISNGTIEQKESFVLHCQLENRAIINSYLYIIGLNENDEVDDYSSDEDDDFKKKENMKNYKKMNEYSLFLIVFKDLSEESEQKAKSFEMKKKSEILMKNIIPDAVYKAVYIHKGPDVFSSNNATIIIAQITGMVETVHTLLPHSIIGLIGSYFDNFDEIANHYQAVHPIFTTENLYIACCGMFDFQDNPAQQALQAVLFALEVKERMKTINKELETFFSIKFEINLGGPLNGCVLSNQTPNFSVSGIIFDQAVDLIFDSEPDTIEISQSVYDFIEDDMQFLISPISEENKSCQFYQIYNVTKAVSSQL